MMQIGASCAKAAPAFAAPSPTAGTAAQRARRRRPLGSDRPPGSVGTLVSLIGLTGQPSKLRESAEHTRGVGQRRAEGQDALVWLPGMRRALFLGLCLLQLAGLATARAEPRAGPKVRAPPLPAAQAALPHNCAGPVDQSRRNQPTRLPLLPPPLPLPPPLLSLRLGTLLLPPSQALLGRRSLASSGRALRALNGDEACRSVLSQAFALCRAAETAAPDKACCSALQAAGGDCLRQAEAAAAGSAEAAAAL